jgi:hypothetical protein
MDALVTITIPEEGALLIKQALSFPVDVQGVKINTPEESQAAVDQTRQIKTLSKQIETYRKSITDPKRAEIEAIMDKFRPAMEFLAKVEVVLKKSITDFDQEQRHLAAEAEKERQRLEKIERDRQAAEQAAAEALLVQAEQAAAAGDTAAAEALEEQAMAAQQVATPISVSVPITTVEKPRGAAVRKIWKCRIVDPKAVPAEFLMPNEKALDAYAKSMKENAALSGCEFFSEDSLAIR